MDAEGMSIVFCAIVALGMMTIGFALAALSFKASDE